MAMALNRELETRGYLSLNKFVKYLKEFHPEASISYPTALKLVGEGKLKATMLGSHYRVSETEAKRWILEGNWERKLASPFSSYNGGMLTE